MALSFQFEVLHNKVVSSNLIVCPVLQPCIAIIDLSVSWVQMTLMFCLMDNHRPPCLPNIGTFTGTRYIIDSRKHVNLGGPSPNVEAVSLLIVVWKPFLCSFSLTFSLPGSSRYCKRGSHWCLLQRLATLSQIYLSNRQRKMTTWHRWLM